MTAHRFHEVRQTAASVEWYELPILGDEDRHAYRARMIRRVGWSIFLFWAGIAFALVCLL